jgi:hypothetical protein
MRECTSVNKFRRLKCPLRVTHFLNAGRPSLLLALVVEVVRGAGMVIRRDYLPLRDAVVLPVRSRRSTRNVLGCL